MKPSEIYKKSVLDAREVMCPPDQACEYVLCFVGACFLLCLPIHPSVRCASTLTIYPTDPPHHHTHSSNPYRAASVMKERFPRVTWYTCSPSGVLAVADPVMAVQYDTRFDSKVGKL